MGLRGCCKDLRSALQPTVYMAGSGTNLLHDCLSQKVCWMLRIAACCYELTFCCVMVAEKCWVDWVAKRGLRCLVSQEDQALPGVRRLRRPRDPRSPFRIVGMTWLIGGPEQSRGYACRSAPGDAKTAPQSSPAHFHLHELHQQRRQL